MFRIYTEDLNREVVERILSDRFDGFTITPGNGWWKGVKENSLTIDIDTDEEERVITVAEKIKTVNDQQGVLVTEYPASSRVV